MNTWTVKDAVQYAYSKISRGIDKKGESEALRDEQLDNLLTDS